MAFKAHEYAPGEPEPIWVGTRSRDEVDRACPEHGRVQGLTDEAADIVTREMGGIGPCVDREITFGITARVKG